MGSRWFEYFENFFFFGEICAISALIIHHFYKIMFTPAERGGGGGVN